MIDGMDDRSNAKGLSSVIDKSDEGLNASSVDFRRLMAMVGASYWLFMTAIVVPTGVVCSLFLFVYPLMIIRWIFGLKMDFVNKCENFVCHMVNDHWVSAGQYTGLNITEYGDDLNDIADDRVLFLCNHLGLVDHFCLMTSFYDKKSLAGRYLWVIFNIWKMTPLGFMWLTHGNFFINGGKTKRAGVLRDFRQHLRRLYWEFNYGTIVMYPEGSRLFLIQEAEKKFAANQGIKAFKNCAHPRSGAAHAVFSVCGKDPKDESKAVAGDFPPIEYVVDCTLGYPSGVPNLANVMLGEWPNENTNVAVHFSIHKVKSEWNDEEKLKTWLYERYAVKDQLLEKFYKTGSFGGKGRSINFPLARNLLVQVFWSCVFYLNYNVWIRPICSLVFSLILSPFI